MTEPFRQRTESTLHLPEWEQELQGLTAGMTTRNGGFGEAPFYQLNLGLHVPDEPETVLKNRQHLASLLDFPLDSWVSGEQVHGSKVKIITREDRGKGAKDYATSIQGVDGILTNDKGVMLTAFYADCVPLFFMTKDSGWIGIAHAGWKGTVHDIGKRMVEALEQQGVDRNDIKVAIGPSIGKAAYEVDQHVIDHVDKRHVEAAASNQSPGKYQLDLKRLNELLLMDAGIKSENIATSSYCTYEERSLFFSHRRDQGKTGRMLGFIGWRS
ncbi:peptidoglycan editing factor PgeF [Thalassobacillus hwangdonensis]|uniref:Purine nucleoside phosphorylase n=1 Tax=Thalassobacillus hwangdonensis TaxID=546108 RepID=A0ABW3KXX5_9BACI